MSAPVSAPAGAASNAGRRQLGDRLLVGWSLATYAFLYTPILVLIVFSFNAAEQSAAWSGFTLRWYEVLWNNEQVWDAAWNSLRVAVGTTVLATSLGTAAALGLRTATRRMLAFTSPLLLLPIILPDIVMAVSLLGLFGAGNALLEGLGFEAMSLSLVTVWFAHVVFSTSYVVVVVRARLAGMDYTLEEAAADLGATPWETFWKVTLPQLWPAVVSGGLLVTTLSIDDYLITSFVNGPGSTTLPIQIYGMVKKKVTPEINAICTLLLLVSTAMIALSWLIERRADAHRSRAT